MRHRCAIFILGAGFSAPAGLPLAPELWKEVRRRAEGMSGRAEKFTDDLEAYLKFLRDCEGRTLTADEVDFEEFLGFLDIEFYLNIRGSDTWSDDGNETQVMIKTLIAQILVERTPPTAEMQQLYRKFAEGLQPHDTVVTFNYDILLERALTLVGKPFRLFPKRYKSVDRGSAEVDYSDDDVRILKLHGSVDWFDKRRYTRLEEIRSSQGFGKPSDPIFGRQNVHVLPLVEGPRFPEDPLREMHRVLDIEAVYRDPPMFVAAPWLLNPSAMKLLYSAPVKEFWGEISRDRLANPAMVIIGYSLPPHDDYARQVMYRLVRNYQSPHWNEVSGRRKKPLVFIDSRQTEVLQNQLKSRYRFVEWSKTQCCFNGFNEDVLPILFSAGD
jgi:hypothetical protein